MEVTGDQAAFSAALPTSWSVHPGACVAFHPPNLCRAAFSEELVGDPLDGLRCSLTRGSASGLLCCWSLTM